MKRFILALLMLSVTSCTAKKTPTALEMCETLCGSDAQSNSKVTLYGFGGCICDNEEGRKMVEGYEWFIQGYCIDHPEDPMEDRD